MTGRFCRIRCRCCGLVWHARDPVREANMHLLHAHAAVTGTRLSIWDGTR